MAFSSLRRHLEKKECIGVCGAVTVIAIILLKYSKSQASHAEVEKSTGCLKKTQTNNPNKEKKTANWNNTHIFWAVRHFKILMEVTDLD